VGSILEGDFKERADDVALAKEVMLNNNSVQLIEIDGKK